MGCCLLVERACPPPQPSPQGGGRHPTPATGAHPNRKSASPPPRGEGMGVGGGRGGPDQVPGHEAMLDEGFHGLLPSCRARLPAAPHPKPPHKGEGAPNRPPPAHNPTKQAPPLPLVGRGWGWGAGEAAPIKFQDRRPYWMRGFMGHSLLVERACPRPPTPTLPTRGREAPDARPQRPPQPKKRLPSPLWGGDGSGGRERRPQSGSGT